MSSEEKVSSAEEKSITSWIREVDKYENGTAEPSKNLRKRVHRNSGGSNASSKKRLHKLKEMETDSVVLDRRQKQIDYGKNTVGYTNYKEKVPLQDRTREDPQTPDKYSKYSRRSWDMLIKNWRKKLHQYDPSISENQADDKNVSSSDDEYFSS